MVSEQIRASCRRRKSGARARVSLLDLLPFLARNMSTSPVPFAGLGSKVKAAYTKAVKSGAVLFTESEVEEADDEETGIPVSSVGRARAAD